MAKPEAAVAGMSAQESDAYMINSSLIIRLALQNHIRELVGDDPPRYEG